MGTVTYVSREWGQYLRHVALSCVVKFNSRHDPPWKTLFEWPLGKGQEERNHFLRLERQSHNQYPSKAGLIQGSEQPYFASIGKAFLSLGSIVFRLAWERTQVLEEGDPSPLRTPRKGLQNKDEGTIPKNCYYQLGVVYSFTNLKVLFACFGLAKLCCGHNKESVTCSYLCQSCKGGALPHHGWPVRDPQRGRIYRITSCSHLSSYGEARQFVHLSFKNTAKIG